MNVSKHSFGWALSLGWWFVTHSLCTLKLAPNLSLQTLPQTSILSPLWPFLFLPSLILSLEFSASHWGETLMLFDWEQNVFRTLCLCFFLVDTLDKRLLWAGCAESWRAIVEFARGLLQVSYSAVWLNTTERSYISSKCCHAHRCLVSIREKKRSLGFWVFCSGCKYPVYSHPLFHYAFLCFLLAVLIVDISLDFECFTTLIESFI